MWAKTNLNSEENRKKLESKKERRTDLSEQEEAGEEEVTMNRIERKWIHDEYDDGDDEEGEELEDEEDELWLLLRGFIIHLYTPLLTNLTSATKSKRQTISPT